jgi:hypothetical protein
LPIKHVHPLATVTHLMQIGCNKRSCYEFYQGLKEVVSIIVTVPGILGVVGAVVQLRQG